ncbi:hypothetical protein G7Y89_g15215 [Cudoniella acicularis]|uniref:TPR-like protein n=1 Tax=Cudoniella acicularis TaxID=354080 RepID=A0A8H4QT16_9HELO|nr:hypothetical protein G7Y89_g15215 [Cudoniella acicularis]
MGALSTDIDDSQAAGYAIFDKRDDQAREFIQQGKIEEAVALLKKNLEWSETNLGSDHFCTVDTREVLAFNLNELRQFTAARDLNKKALETRQRIEGEDPPSKRLLKTQLHLANDFFKLDKYKTAAQYYEKTYNARTKVLGEEHNDTLETGYDLATCFSAMGRYKDSQDLNQKILDTRIRLKAHPTKILRSRKNLASDLFHLGDFEKAKALNLECVKYLIGKGKGGGLLKKCQEAAVLCDEKLEIEAKLAEQRKERAQELKREEEAKLAEQKEERDLELKREEEREREQQRDLEQMKKILELSKLEEQERQRKATLALEEEQREEKARLKREEEEEQKRRQDLEQMKKRPRVGGVGRAGSAKKSGSYDEGRAKRK